MTNAMRMSRDIRRKTSFTFMATMLLLSSLALLTPVPRVYAQSTVLSVSPPITVANIVAPVGVRFDVPIVVSDVTQLVGYDVTLSFDESQLSYVSTSVPSPWNLCAAIKGPGSIRQFCATTAPGGISVAAGSNSVIVTHTFMANLEGFSLLQISSGSVLSVLPVPLPPGCGFPAGPGCSVPQPYTIFNGGFKSQFKSTVFFADAKPTADAVDTTVGATGMNLLATVQNAGSTSVMAFVTYRLISQSGRVFGVTSATFSVPTAGNGKSTTFFAVEPVPDEFQGSSVLFVSTDGGVTFTVADVRQLNHAFTVIA